jgi:hypothetical protein
MKTFHLLILFMAVALITSVGLNSVTGETLTNSTLPSPTSHPPTSSSPTSPQPNSSSLTSPLPDSPSLTAAAPAEHSTITSYTGPSTCLVCHRQQAVSMFGSVHYQWTGATPNVPNIPGDAGKGEMGFNTYCGSVETSRHIACYSCHAGAGLAPNQTVSEAQLSNIDCMTCHQEQYLRTPAPPFENLTFADYNGVNHTWRLPVEDAQGSFQYVIDEARMPVSAVEAAQTVHAPTRGTCLSCHAYAAGSDCGKRGDLSSAMVNPPVAVDVHMSPQGANLTCQACHQFTSHRVLGRGLDIRQNDVAVQLTCTSPGCHSSTPHTITELNNHTSRVSCQACHIPEYAKLNTTEMQRNWTNPYWFPGMFSNQGGYKPEEIRQGNVTPTYAWFNSTSYVYVRGQVPPLRPDGMYEFAAPYGSVNEGQIVPMKEHTSNSAMLDSTRQMIPFSTFTFFVTGDFNRAVQDGQEYFGMTGNWSMVDVHTYQTINHQVEPALNALQCGDCHAAYAGGAPTRMDLQGSLGYAPEQPLSQTCSQCHSVEDNPGFVSVHNRHLNEGIACSSCHAFSRPERQGLKSMAGVFRPIDGNWYLDYNKTGVVEKVFHFGKMGDNPVVGDWDGNGISDAGVFRPATGTWYLDTTKTGVVNNSFQFGKSGDIPVVGDWDGNGISDISVFRSATGTWYLDTTKTGVVNKSFQFGKSGDIPVVGDWDGNGISDIGVFRLSTGTWFLNNNKNGVIDNTFQFGKSGDIPVVGDWDGNGISDIGVFRPTMGTWYLDTIKTGVISSAFQFGKSGDIPVVGRWI